MSTKTIRAKFKCDGVETSTDGTNKSVAMSAVIEGDGVNKENASFAKYTPSGNLTINVNEGTEAFDAFEPGKEYYLDFSLAE